MLPKKSDRYLVLAIGLGTLMTSFDSSAVGVILPVITHKLHSNIQSGKWVVTIYLLVISSLLLVSGRLGDILGYRRLYLTGLAISFAGSLLCAQAASIGMLVCCRVVEATGIVLVLANGVALLTRHGRTERRGRLLGFISTMAYIGLTVGTSLSGWLSNMFGWQSVFIVVAFLSAAAFTLCLNVIPRDAPYKTAEGLNIPGTILLLFALGAWVLAFHLSNNLGWHSLTVAGLAAGGLIALLVAIGLGPTEKIGIIFNPPIAVATIAGLFSYISLYSMTFILPFYLLDGLAFNPAKIGIILSIRPAVTALLNPISGALADRYGTRRLVMPGLFIMLVAFATCVGIDNQSGIITFVLSLAGIGLGMGLFLAPNHSFIMSAVPPQFRGSASATISLTRNLGMLLGVSLGGAYVPTTQEYQAHIKHSINSAAHSVFGIATCIVGMAVIIMFIDCTAYLIKQRNVRSAAIISAGKSIIS